MNQTDFGNEIGVARQTVGEWERGDSEPSKLNQQALDEMAAKYPVSLAGSASVGLGTTGSLSSGQRVSEEPPMYNAHLAEVRGRSIEVEALLAYALERQRLLTQALGGGAMVTPTDGRGAAMGASVAVVQVETAGGREAAPRPQEKQA